jgi:hypothetical protein
VRKKLISRKLASGEAQRMSLRLNLDANKTCVFFYMFSSALLKLGLKIHLEYAERE